MTSRAPTWFAIAAIAAVVVGILAAVWLAAPPAG
jgi:hypothetical protein